MDNGIKPYDIEAETSDDGCTVSFFGETYSDVRVEPSMDIEDAFEVSYEVIDGNGASAGVLSADGIVTHGFTPDCFDVRIMDDTGDKTVLFDWHSDYDRTPYQPDGESVMEMSAELAWMMCHAIEEHYRG